MKKFSFWALLLLMPLSLLLLAQWSYGALVPRFQLYEVINPINEPERLGLRSLPPFNKNLLQLPTIGKSRKALWDGDYWPDSRGGTATRRYHQLSPMEKYDRATGQNYLATRWEVLESRRGRNVSWAGHCNGLAGAVINEAEPLHSVVYGGIRFEPEDIKALLVEAYQGNCSPKSLVGRRVFFDIFSPYDRTISADLRDLNPGSMHILLSNLLGIYGQSFIMDTTLDSAVWNYPVVSFQSSITPISASYAARELRGRFAVNYPYNDQAKKFAYVHTSITLPKSVKNYSYILELDNNGNIIGGEWIGPSLHNHPDFAWTITGPCLANPHLNWEVIKKIAQQSH